MPSYIVTLTNDERQELKELIQKGGKGYRIRYQGNGRMEGQSF